MSLSSSGMGDFECFLSKCCLYVFGSGIAVLHRHRHISNQLQQSLHCHALNCLPLSSAWQPFLLPFAGTESSAAPSPYSISSLFLWATNYFVLLSCRSESPM